MEEGNIRIVRLCFRSTIHVGPIFQTAVTKSTQSLSLLDDCRQVFSSPSPSAPQPRVVVIGEFPLDAGQFHPFRSELMKEFAFKPAITAKVDKFLATVRADRNLTEVTLVGVHVRRTDYA